MARGSHLTFVHVSLRAPTPVSLCLTVIICYWTQVPRSAVELPLSVAAPRKLGQDLPLDRVSISCLRGVKIERGKGRKAQREEGGSLLARGCPLLPRMFSMTLRGQCPHTRSFHRCKLSRSSCSSPECPMCQRPGARGPEPSSHLSCLAHRFVWESPGNRGPCCQP